jgi:hypothetical protein
MASATDKTAIAKAARLDRTALYLGLSLLNLLFCASLHFQLVQHGRTDPRTLFKISFRALDARITRVAKDATSWQAQPDQPDTLAARSKVFEPDFDLFEVAAD